VDRTAAYAAGIANIDKRPRARLEHVCKIFCRRYEASVPIDVRLADEISRNVGDKPCLGRIIDERGEYVREVDFGSRAKGCGDLGGRRSTQGQFPLRDVHRVSLCP
jgi:hypothetical protein